MPPRARGRAQNRAGASTSRTRSRQKRQRTPTPPPSPLPWDLGSPVNDGHYRRLHKRELAPTKFFDPFTIHNLGLRGDVNNFINSIGWVQYASLNLPTYKQLTYEFLSTLSQPPDGDGGHMAITFRCMGEERHLTLGQFNNLFGFPNEGIDFYNMAYIPENAWITLAGQESYNPSAAKSTHIRSHALRYIHRCMSLGMFGRGLSTGVVSKTDLLFLWAMANNVRVNTGYWLIRHLLHVSMSKKGQLCVGGLITHIARAFGFEPVAGIHDVVEGNTLVDMITLTNMRMIRHIGGGQYRLLDAGGHIFQPVEEEEEEEDDDDDEDHDDEPHPEVPPQPEPQPEFPQPPAPQPEVDMGGHPAYDQQLARIIETLERLDARQEQLDARQARSEEMQLRMMEMLQRMERRDR